MVSHVDWATVAWYVALAITSGAAAAYYAGALRAAGSGLASEQAAKLRAALAGLIASLLPAWLPLYALFAWAAHTLTGHDRAYAWIPWVLVTLIMFIATVIFGLMTVAFSRGVVGLAASRWLPLAWLAPLGVYLSVILSW